MDVISLCPLRVASLIWEAEQTLVVVCKATYRLAMDVSPLAEHQEAPNEADSYWDDDPRRTLAAGTDLVPIKPRADVLLVGHAYAPGGQPTRSFGVRMLVGEIDKPVEVWCDRAWSVEGELREGAPFVRMPLGYERAAGGLDTWNPVGIPHGAPPNAMGEVPVPNLQRLGLLVADRSVFIGPIGFGPIAPTWPSRVERLGPSASGWSETGWYTRRLPEDFDIGFFNCAPHDQQAEELRGDERIVLENLHPEHPYLVTGLPGLRPRAFVERPGAPIEEVSLQADTLCIDTDQSICTLVWRARVALGAVRDGRVLVLMEEAGKPLSWEEVVRLCGGGMAPAMAPGAAAPAGAAAVTEAAAGAGAGAGAGAAAGAVAAAGAAAGAIPIPVPAPAVAPGAKLMPDPDGPPRPPRPARPEASVSPSKAAPAMGAPPMGPPPMAAPAMGPPPMAAPVMGPPSVKAPATGTPPMGVPAVGAHATGAPAMGHLPMGAPAVGAPAMGHSPMGAPMGTPPMGVPAPELPAQSQRPESRPGSRMAEAAPIQTEPHIVAPAIPYAESGSANVTMDMHVLPGQPMPAALPFAAPPAGAGVARPSSKDSDLPTSPPRPATLSPSGAGQTAEMARVALPPTAPPLRPTAPPLPPPLAPPRGKSAPSIATGAPPPMASGASPSMGSSASPSMGSGASPLGSGAPPSMGTGAPPPPRPATAPSKWPAGTPGSKGEARAAPGAEASPVPTPTPTPTPVPAPAPAKHTRSVGDSAGGVAPGGVTPGGATPGGATPIASSAPRTAITVKSATSVRAIATAAPAPDAVPASPVREAVKLLWFDPECLTGIRNHPRWRALLAELDHERSRAAGDDSSRNGQSSGDPRKKDRAEVFEVLVRGEPASAADLDRAFVEAMDEDGRFEPPLALVSGDLELPFDELELLKATVTMASPLALGDKKLKDTLDGVNEVLKIPGLHSAGGFADGLTRRVEEAFAPVRERQKLPADYLETGRTRMLLAQRHYQRRTLWGTTWLRGLLRPTDGGAVITYVPEELANKLPQVPVMRVKVLGEVDSWQELGDVGSALRVGALGLSVRH